MTRVRCVVVGLLALAAGTWPCLASTAARASLSDNTAPALEHTRAHARRNTQGKAHEASGVGGARERLAREVQAKAKRSLHEKGVVDTLRGLPESTAKELERLKHSVDKSAALLFPHSQATAAKRDSQATGAAKDGLADDPEFMAEVERKLGLVLKGQFSKRASQQGPRQKATECTPYSPGRFFTSAYGDCSAYASAPNSYFCNIDTDDLTGLFTASQACAECGECEGSTVSRPSVSSRITSATNSPTNTVTFTFDERVDNFSLDDLSIAHGGTLAELDNLQSTAITTSTGDVVQQVVVTIVNATATGQYVISLVPSVTTVSGRRITQTVSYTGIVDFCASHYDCGFGRYCFSCFKCISLYGTNVCGSCHVADPNTGSCGPYDNCATDDDSIGAKCPTLSDPCTCTADGRSGSSSTGMVGCASWEDYLAPICYVNDPNNCNGSFPSTQFSSAKWRYCTPNPNPGQCPAGVCESSNGQCTIFDNGLHCRVDNCDQVPAPLRCWQYNGQDYFSYDPRQDQSTFTCQNDGVSVVGMGTKFECDGEDASREQYQDSSGSNCTTTTVPVDYCVCPQDHAGVTCGSERTLSCRILPAPCVPIGGSRDFQRFDPRLPGYPICFPVLCNVAGSSPAVYEGAVECNLTARFDETAFLDDSGVSQQDYDDAVQQIRPKYVITYPTFSLTYDPRVYVVFEAIDLARIYTRGEGIVVGMSSADINTGVKGELVRLHVDEIVASNPRLVRGGRVYFEAQTRRDVDGRVVVSDSQPMFVDCVDFDFADKPASVNTGQQVGIVVALVVVVGVVAGLVWRWRVKREGQKKKKDE